MQKTLPIKKHGVKAHIQILELTKAGSSIEFEIFADQEKIGRIVIGQGSLTWFGKKRKTGKTVSWSRFAEIMDDISYG
ncbi:MAG: hypothetical protein H0V88_03915 [Pyrinomonadaceae bacterium]|nr:hypothetical protein [Pyrinomonadaceae bacterium]